MLLLEELFSCSVVLFVVVEPAGLLYVGLADLVIVAVLDALTFELDDGLDAVAGLETVPLLLRTVLDERLLVLPTLMPPLIVPPDVRIVGLEELPAAICPRSVLARRPWWRGSKWEPPTMCDGPPWCG